MKNSLLLIGAAAAFAVAAVPAEARDRYAERPPVVVSPDLSAPWVMQLRRKPGTPAGAPRLSAFQMQPLLMRSPAAAGPTRSRPRRCGRCTPSGRCSGSSTRNSCRSRSPMTARKSPAPSSSIAAQKFLYLVMPNGQARRYGVGVGKEGFGWTGTQNITRKAEWPDWRPPAEMIVREREKGRILPVMMEGGPANPLGARALYLGSTLYRIHGTNAPWTIGTNVSSGCIRLRNEDVVDLFERVNVGTKVIVM